jgi:hypothetical protein
MVVYAPVYARTHPNWAYLRSVSPTKAVGS